MGHDFHKIWIKQCEAAAGIGDRFNRNEALDYLVGEKFVNFVRAANTHSEFEDELPSFAAEVKRLFGEEDLRTYLAAAQGAGQRTPRYSDGELRALPRDEAVEDEIFDEDPVMGAEEIMVLERVKDLLLGR